MKTKGFSIGIVFLLVIACVSCEKYNDLGTFIDSRDGQEYQMVEIGKQVWMKENLNYPTDSGSWIYDNDTSNALIYGRLYNWETACKVCPDGWYLPSDDEWTILLDYLGGRFVAVKLREEGDAHWLPGWKDATNESGFTALPAGILLDPGSNHFGAIGIETHFWSSTEASDSEAWDRWFSNAFLHVSRSDRSKDQGISVRCMQD